MSISNIEGQFFIVYIDDMMFLGKSECQLSNIVKELQDVGLGIEDKGHPVHYVCVNIQKHDGRSYEFTQRALIVTNKDWPI